jgi:peptidoglycan glycosyltransferase
LLAFMLAPVFLLFVAAGVGVVAGGAAYYGGVTAEVKSPAQAIAERGGGARIYDRNGAMLYQYVDDRYGRQERVSLDQISPLVQNATIAAEDASFYSNPGINIKGIARASIENLQPGDDFLQGTGGSSITQQLVKQLYFTQEEREQRTISRKLRKRRSHSISRAITRRSRSSSGT